MRANLVALLAACALLGLGCGDDDGAGSPNGNDGGDGEPSTLEPGAMTSKEISAAQGGEVALGPVKLTIPAGALADDTTITVEVLDKDEQPGAEDIVAEVFDFGPDGTEFLEPVTLELDVGNLAVPSGQQAMLAFLDGDAWTTLEDSKLQGGKVSATTTHFTPFTVVLVFLPDGGTTQVGGACGSPEDFDACGGDLTGTWEYTGACVTLPPDVLDGNGDKESPFATCTDQPQVSATVDLTGTTTFAADGSFMLEQTVSFSSEFLVPGSCVEQLTMGMVEAAMACEQLLMGTLDADGNCKAAAGEPSTEMNTGEGTWTADEATGTLTIVDSSPDAGSDSDVIHYCVSGETVTVLVENADEGFTMEYKATRTSR